MATGGGTHNASRSGMRPTPYERPVRESNKIRLAKRHGGHREHGGETRVTTDYADGADETRQQFFEPSLFAFAVFTV